MPNKTAKNEIITQTKNSCRAVENWKSVSVSMIQEKSARLTAGLKPDSTPEGLNAMLRRNHVIVLRYITTMKASMNLLRLFPKKSK